MRATKTIQLKRENEIACFLIEGKTRDFIIQYSSENWSLGERMVDKYINRAKNLISESIDKDLKYDYSKALRRYEKLFELSFHNKDYKTAITINKEIATLQGLYKVQIEHSGSVEFISNIPE